MSGKFFLLATFAFLVDFLFAWCAITSVTFLLTLVDSARKEPFTWFIASWDWVCAGLALTSIYKLFYGAVAGGAVLNALRVAWARTTIARVARSFTGVVATIKGLPADFIARVLSCSTYSFNRVLTAEASYSLNFSTGCT